jgi:hypothetical protein
VICANHHEPDTTTLMAKLQSSFKHSEPFRLVLDRAHIEGVSTPSNLVLGGFYAVIEVILPSQPWKIRTYH